MLQIPYLSQRKLLPAAVQTPWVYAVSVCMCPIFAHSAQQDKVTVEFLWGPNLFCFIGSHYTQGFVTSL